MMKGLPRWITTLLLFALYTSLPATRLKANGNGSGAGDVKVPAASNQNPAQLQQLEQQVMQLRDEIDAMKKKSEAQTALPTAASAPVQASAPAVSPTATAVAAAMPGPADSPAPGAPAAPPSVVKTLWDTTTVQGYADGYYQYDFNEPAGRQNALHAFDNLTNQFSLNLAELRINRSSDDTNRLGYNLVFGYGNAANVVNGTEPGTAYAPGASFDRNVIQAYVSYLVPVGKGLTVNFGKFVTPAGAEVIESYGDWNYTRGLLFTFAIPFYHFGLNASYTFSPKVTLTGYVLNGWNNVVAINTGKTLGFSLALNPTKKLSVIENYLGGPQTAQSNSHWRHLTDTVVQYNATSKFSLLENFDWGGGDMIPGVANSVHWLGFATYGRYAFTGNTAFTARYEYYDDHDGFTMLGLPHQHVHEYTATLEHIFAGYLITRLEFRRDMSNQYFFPMGDGLSKNQNTLTAGLMYLFDIHTAK